MLRSPTVLVLGAGASAEVGLPTGAQLKSHLKSLLNLRYEFGTQLRSGDPVLHQVFVNRRQTSNGYDITPDVSAARSVQSGLDQALSIDNYLEAHNDDEDVVVVGKLAIARAISIAQTKSRLLVNTREEKTLDPGTLSDTWLLPFWQMCHENVTRINVAEIFQNLTVVSFNYDRCLQQFLLYALMSYYRLTESEAFSVLQTLTIIFPYGNIGDFDSRESFGRGLDASTLPGAAQRIKIFTEQAESEIADQLGRTMMNAYRVIFLGFAYHRQNMRLISTDVNKQRDIFATTLGISTYDEAEVERRIQNYIPSVTSLNRPRLSNSTCSEFFNKFWYNLT